MREMGKIEIRGLSKAFGEKRVLEDVSLVLPEGSVTAILAPSGFGKTTLVRILLGLEKQDAGEIRGTEGLRMAAVFQEDRLCEDFGAIANIRLAAPTCPRADIRKALQDFGLEDAGDGPVRAFSGGMKRRVALLRAVLCGADLIVLDEPFHGLDDALREQVIARTAGYCKGKTVVLVTHDLHEAEKMGTGQIVHLDSM